MPRTRGCGILPRARVKRIACWSASVIEIGLGLDRLTIPRHSPVRHLATALVLPSAVAGQAVPGQAPEDLDPEVRRRSEKAAEDLVIAYEKTRGWEPERVGHLEIGFDVQSLGPADPPTGYRDPERASGGSR